MLGPRLPSAWSSASRLCLVGVVQWTDDEALLWTSPEQTYSVGNGCCQDRQYMLNVNIEAHSFNHFCRGKRKVFIFWVCVCSLSCPTRSAHAPYCHLWPRRLYNIFPHYLIIGASFELFFWKISHFKKNWERCDQKRILVLMYITCYSCQFLMQLELSEQIFEKSSNIKFHENPSRESRIVPFGQTWRSQ